MDSNSFCGHLITLSNNPSICHAVAEPQYSPRICPLLTTAGGLLTPPPMTLVGLSWQRQWLPRRVSHRARCNKKKKCELISAKGQRCKHNQIQKAIDNNKEIRVKALKSIRGSSPLYCYVKCWLVEKSVFTKMLGCIDEQKLGTIKMFKKHM